MRVNHRRMTQVMTSANVASGIRGNHRGGIPIGNKFAKNTELNELQNIRW